MEFSNIINCNYLLVKRLSHQTYQQHLINTLRGSSIKTISTNISPSYNKLSTNLLHTLPSFHNSFIEKKSLLNHFEHSHLSYPSQTFTSTSLFDYTPFFRKEHFRISSLFSKEESKSSEKVIHQLKNEVLAPPLTEEQIAKHEREKEIYQRIRKFEHYNYFRSISKPSYYDALEIDEEDKKLSLIDRIIHRHFSHRHIQHKYNGRNLNRGFVFVKPAKDAKETTTLCDCSTDRSPRELMVLLGWWNCHPKHLKKYVKLYSNLGHPVLAHISPTLLLVVPKILNIKNEHLMKQLFQLWRQRRSKGEEYKIMFHTFSDNGSYVFAHFTYVLQVNLRKYKKKMKVREQRILKKLNLVDSISVISSAKAVPSQYPLATANDKAITSKASGPQPKEMTENDFLAFLNEKEQQGEWKKNDRVLKLIKDYRKAKKDFEDYEAFFYCMEAAIMDSGPSLLTQSVITRGITAGITSMKFMKYFGVKHTHYSPTLSKMICYFYYIFVRQPSIAKYLLDIYYPAFYNVPKHMAYMFMYGNGDRVICPDLIEPYIYNLQKNGFLVRRAYFEGSDHVMHFVVHREVYENEVLKFIHDIREHSKIECKSGVRVIYDEKTGIIQDHEKILIPDKRKSNIKSVWARAIADEEHFRFLGIIPKRFDSVESRKDPFADEDITTNRAIKKDKKDKKP